MLTTIIAIALVVAGTSGGVWAFIKKVWPLLRKVVHFLDDWLGREETTGREAQPGIMQRLHQIEQTQFAHTQSFEVVRHELFPNSGASLRDVADRHEASLVRIEALLADLNRG